MKHSIVATVFALLTAVSAYSQGGSEERRQFDFWLGEWDVNLRVQQKDHSWKDQHKAVARIYSVLGGRAILELWSEKQDGINGYSLRYFNPSSGKWDLWLNWVGKNRSGTSSLTGSFRHDRGEFFSERKIDETTTQISRYTFSDISKDSLRWDDGYSRDGGKTWASNWIMEFTRRSERAPGIASDKNLHTFYQGTTCDLPEFEILTKLSMSQKNSDSFRLYNVLDGCMIIGFAESEGSNVFFTLTFNTYAKIYEFTFLNDAADSYMAVYYGSRTADGFELKKLGKDGESSKALVKVDEIIRLIELDYRGKEYSLVQ